MDVFDRTKAFYDWEIRGRGWIDCGEPVELEPQFVGFNPWRVVESRVDDGRRPTLLSRMLESFAKPVAVEDDEPEAADAIQRARPEEFEGSFLLVPIDIDVEAADILAWAHGLSGLRRRAAFEVVWRDGEIHVHFAAAGGEHRHAASQLLAVAPNIVVRESLQPSVECLEVDASDGVVLHLGMASEFVLPLNGSASDESLLSLFAGMAQMPTSIRACVQVLFEPAREPWQEQIARAVVTPSGQPFFADAPEITQQAAKKVASPLFAVALRVSVVGRSAVESRDWAYRLASQLSFGSGLHANELIPVAEASGVEAIREVVERTNNRPGMLLSAEELTLLLKLPGEGVVLPALVRPLERTKAGPEETHQSGNLLGVNEHEEVEQEVQLSETARMKHVHLLGASGVGKSTLMVQMILNDLEAGYGVGILDPHGDLVREVAARVPQERVADTVLFDPGAEGPVVGWNVLHAGSDTEREMLTSDLVGIFRRLSTSWGDQMNAVFANAIMVFLEPEIGGTLSDLRQFLADAEYRRATLAKVGDPHVREFWDTEFPLIEKRRPQAPILTRLDAFLRSKAVRRVLNVRDAKLDFERVLNQGRIFLGNLAMGAIGEDNAALLGSLLVSRFHQVSLLRSGRSESTRRPFFLYIDEFHHVATPSMGSLFSGARKFRLGLTVAHQDLYQLRATAPELERSLLSNAYSRICFRLGDADATTLERGFSYFTAEDLMDQEVGRAICRVGTRAGDFNLKTSRLPEVESLESEARIRAVAESSQARWGVDEVEPEVHRPQSTDESSSEPTAVSDESKAAQDSSEEQVHPQLSKSDLDYLESIATQPFLGIRERNEELSLSAWKGDRLKKRFLAEDLLREVEINPGGRGSQFKLLELTSSGRAVLREYKIPVVGNLGRGGLAHQWWVNHIAEWLRERCHKVSVEDESSAARVDLVASLSRIRTAVEIDFRAEQAIHNIRKDAEAGFKKVISLVDGIEVADSVRAAVSDLDTISATVADLREFDLVLESPGRPNQNRKQGGARRGRRSARVSREPQAVVLDGGALDTPLAATYLGLSPATLETLRSRGGGPRFSKLGRRVVYQREELDAWMAERSQRSTSDE